MGGRMPMMTNPCQPTNEEGNGFQKIQQNIANLEEIIQEAISKFMRSSGCKINNYYLWLNMNPFLRASQSQKFMRIYNCIETKVN